VNGQRREPGATAAERERVQRIHALISEGAAERVNELLAMRTDPSWEVRREVIAALGQLGEAALGALCTSLANERGDETRIAATVDALVASTGDVDARLTLEFARDDSAVLADIAQILGRRRSSRSVATLAELSRSADDNVAVSAIEGLGRVGGRAVVDVLVQSVQSKNFFRTFAAIDVLGKSGDPRAIAPLSALLDNPQYAFEAARALGRSCDRSAAAPLCALLASPVDSLVRVAAVALTELRQKHGERFGTAASIDAAISRAAPRGATRRVTQSSNGAEPNEQVALNIILGCLGDESAIPMLLRALDGPPSVARAAADALEQISKDSHEEFLMALWEGNSARRQMLLPSLKGRGATDAIIACLTDGDAVVRRLACDALGRIGSRRAVPDLFEALRDENAAVVQAATAAIVSLGYEEAPALALAAAASPEPSVRRAALRILSLLSPPTALSALQAATRDADARVREAGIMGLAMLELPEAVAVLSSLAVDPSARTRAIALRALGELGKSDAQIAERVAAAIDDTDAWVRYYACQASGKLRLEALAPRLAAAVNDPAGQVRVAAIEALSHLAGDEAFAVLLDAASSTEIDLQRAALIGLGLSRRHAAMDILLSNANSSDAATRLITLSALSNIDAPQTFAALVAALRDPDESVRMAALGFVASKPGAEATQTLATFLTDPTLGDQVSAAISLPHEHRVAGLSSALQKADDELALLITGSLARLNRPEATAALFEALTLPNGAARRAAATTLGAIGSREALSALQRLSTEDPDAEMRRICALLLAQ
jgi:HEAT repeat protein